MIPVEQDLYDGNGVGDGNLTQVTQYADSSSSDDRVTQYAYDGRDRLVATKSGVQSSEDTTTHRPILYDTLDNLGEVTAIGQYDGDGVTLTSAAPAASLLRAYETIGYDDQGGIYQTQQYDVNQSTGAVSASALTTNLYDDHRGDLIAESDPGGLWTKDQYDGAGRLISESQTDGGGGTSWSAAESLTGDQVLTQTLTTYDADSNPILVADKERFSTDTAADTGPLGDPTTGPEARVYYTAYYYDANSRPTAVVDVGTNGGAAYTPPRHGPGPLRHGAGDQLCLRCGGPCPDDHRSPRHRHPRRLRRPGPRHPGHRRLYQRHPHRVEQPDDLFRLRRPWQRPDRQGSDALRDAEPDDEVCLRRHDRRRQWDQLQRPAGHGRVPRPDYRQPQHLGEQSGVVHRQPPGRRGDLHRPQRHDTHLWLRRPGPPDQRRGDDIGERRRWLGAAADGRLQRPGPAVSLHQLQRGQRWLDRQPGRGCVQRPGPDHRRVPGADRRRQHRHHARGPVRLHRDVRRPEQQPSDPDDLSQRA